MLWLQVKSHGGCKQGVGVQKWGCSSVVFDGNCVAEITPRPSSASFQFTDYDKNRVLTANIGPVSIECSPRYLS